MANYMGSLFTTDPKNDPNDDLAKGVSYNISFTREDFVKTWKLYQLINKGYNDANFHGVRPMEVEEPGVDLLFDALDSYVRSTDMATRCLGSVTPPYPHLLYYTVPRSRPESVIEANLQNNNMDKKSDQSLAEDDVNLATYPRDTLSPRSPLARRRLRAGQRMAAASCRSSQVANRLVKFARCIRNIYESEMSCFNCGVLPICPITGQCGHTRCHQCAAESILCPCGYYFSGELFVNVLIKDLIRKSPQSSRIVPLPISPAMEDINATMRNNNRCCFQSLPGASRCHTRLKRRARACSPNVGCQRIPITPLARYNHALDLLRLGHHREAVPYLALAVAGQPDLRPARTLLAQAITVLSNNRDPRELTTQLTRAVRRLCSMSWIRSADLECILCYDTFVNPVTTPCGHVFCRTCLERTMDYGKRCPLCLRELKGFTLSQTSNTLFVEAALHIVNAVVVPLPLEPDLIPIFVCTVAYPSVPCPLFIFDPRYWLMIRRVLESGSRRFGMVACERGQDYANYGTILEVRDCVQLEDGRSILSTIGLSRFKVLEREVRDGCDVARIMPITDTKPRDQYKIKVLAENIMFKALMWLDRLNSRVLADIEAAFGELETSGFYEEPWWEGPDGPSWLWWLIAVLPLRTEIKVLILSTDCLTKRMMAVARTLDAVEQNMPGSSGSL